MRASTREFSSSVNETCSAVSELVRVEQEFLKRRVVGLWNWREWKVTFVRFGGADVTV